MTPERYERLMEFFDRACSLAPLEQAGVVDELRAADPGLAVELEAMLAEDRTPGDFLVGPGSSDRVDLRRLVELDSTMLGGAGASPRPPGSPASAPRGEDRGALGAGAVIADRYRLDERIGQGGVGTVYRARDLHSDTVVAVKLLRPEMVADPRQVRRFRREFRAISRIDHPGCLSVFGEGVHHGQRFLVTEYVPGGNLERLVGAASEILLPILIQVGLALDCIHSRNIIHRDLKPANILLGPGNPPMPKLADFGIVKLDDELETQLTESGAVLGTIDYVSPEQLDGKEVDPRSDLYSLGCVIFRLWARRPPFVGTPFQRVRARYDAPAPSLLGLAPDVPPALAALVARLLQRDPLQRPQRARDVAHELAAILGDQGPHTVPSLALEDPTRVFLYRPGFVGRDAELETLTGEIEDAATGERARLIAVAGPVGLGKTTLVQQAAAALGSRGARVLTVETRIGHRAPFAPFPAVIAAAEAARGGTAATEVFGESLSGGRQAHLQLQSDDAAVARRRLARRVGDALLALHRDAPVVLVLENLHNAETSALALIEDVLVELDRHGPRRPVILATTRVAGRSRLDAAMHEPGRVAWLALAPLPDRAVEVIARTMLATHESALPPQLVTRLVSACAGNPLLVQSALRDLVDRGHLSLRGSRWTLTSTELDSVIDRAVSDEVRAQLSRLSDATRRVLAIAAVCGRAFDLDLVCSVGDLDEDVALDALDEAIRASVIEELPRSGRPELYAFEHDHLVEVLRSLLDDQPRRRHHDAVGAVLEQRGSASPATLALHFARGNDADRAFRYLREAGVADFAAGDYASALAHLRDALDKLPDATSVTAEARDEVVELLADASLASGRARDSVGYLQSLVPLKRSPLHHARWLHKLGLALMRTDEVAEGLASLEAGLAALGDRVSRHRWGRFARIARDVLLTVLGRLVRRTPRYDAADEQRAVMHRELGLIHRWIDFERCGMHLAAFVRLAYRLDIPSFRGEAHVGTAFLYSLRSRLKAAARHHDTAIEIARSHGDMRGLALAELVHGGTQSLISDDQDTAFTHFDTALQVAESHGDRFLLNFVLTQRGWGRAILGFSEAAADDFRRAGALADELDVAWLRHEAACGRGLTMVFHGEFEESVAYAREVLTSDIRLTLPVFEAMSNEILGLEATLTGRFRDSIAYFDRALSQYRHHHLLDGWGVLTRIGVLEARLCLADEQGAAAVPDLLPTLRGGGRLFRRVSRLPPLRGADYFARGLYHARRGNPRRARALFARTRTERALGKPAAYMDTWTGARIAFELHRLGEDPAATRAELERVDQQFRDLKLHGMRDWLARLRSIHNV